MSRDASSLFTPYNLGGIHLKNRIVMAPLTRNRATRGTDVPHQLNAIYYAQRATAGLIIAEATQISPVGKGYAWTPGIYNDAQIAGWRLVTDAVHAQGGKIILQLWHVGRFSHPSLQPDGQRPVGPSEIGPENAMTYIEDDTFAKVLVPRAMTHDDIKETIDDYRKAAKHALAAGFDGVEIHAANGYLLDQFLRDGANYRTDTYGGSVENRMRFPLAVVDAVVKAIGAEKTGIRISPTTPAGGLSDTNENACTGGARFVSDGHQVCIAHDPEHRLRIDGRDDGTAIQPLRGSVGNSSRKGTFWDREVRSAKAASESARINVPVGTIRRDFRTDRTSRI